MSSLSSQEGIDKIADQSGIELLPLDQNEDDKSTKKSDAGSYHSDGSLSSLSVVDAVDGGGVRAGAGGRAKRPPRMELIQAVKVANHTVIDEWVEYLKVHPEDDWGDKLIDECDYDDDMNAVHVAVIRNKTKILEKLADAGADLEKCTEDEAENPPLVLAARQLPKNLFEEEVGVRGPTPDRGDEDGKRLSKFPASKAKPKGEEPHRERAVTVGKDAKAKKEKIEKITAEKDITGKVETTFHVLLHRNVKVNSQNEAGITALHAACDRGIIAMVKELLLTEGIDINKTDQQKNTPLHTACLGGQKDCVFALIEGGADLLKENHDEMIPLHVAVVERRFEVVKLILTMCADKKEDLLSRDDKDGYSPFLLAVKSGDEEMVKFFLENGASVSDQNNNGASALHLSASLNKVNIMELIYSAEDGEGLLDEGDWNERTPMHYAAKHNQVDALEFLIKKGADKEYEDYNGRTPLLSAAAYGKSEAVVTLLENDADVEVTDSDGNNVVHIIVEQGLADMLRAVIKSDAGRDLCSVEGHNGNTPLHSSCDKGDLEIVKIFLETDVTIDERNHDNQTPLHLACKGGHHETVAELLKRGARMTIKDEDGNTPLHFASSSGHLETVKLLVNNQADIDPATEEIGTPLTCAAGEGHEVIVDYLLKSGADVDGKFLDGEDIETTPLIAASQNGHVRIVKRLLKGSADVTLEEYYSELNCLGEAVVKGHSDVALAIIQSDQWEEAMRLCTDWDHLTPMKLLIKSMPEVATVVLNRCITDNKSKDVQPDDESYCVTYNYEFLEDYKEEVDFLFDDDDDDDDSIAPRRNARDDDDDDDDKPDGGKEKSKKKERKKKKPFRWGPSGFKKQEHPLQFMVESQRIELLNHPIVTNLLNHKWRSFGRTFYFVNMSTYLIFLVFLTAFALLSPTPFSDDCKPRLQCSLFNDSCIENLNLTFDPTIDDTFEIGGTSYETCRVNFTKTTTNFMNGTATTTDPIVHCFGIRTFAEVPDEGEDCINTENYERSFLRGAAIIVIIFAVIRVLIEIMQILRKRLRYFLDWENWMELCLFIATIIFVSAGLQSGCLCPKSWQWQLGALAMFIAWLDLVLFLKKFPLTGIYVVMFVDIFYTFMRMILLSILFVVSFGLAFYMLFFRPGTRSAFSSPGRSLVKTMVMTTGEFEFDGIFFNSQEDAEAGDDLFYPQIAYILWIVFIILMPIILTNLLVGLAVDDIKGVQETAALKRLALQVDLALDVEDLMFVRIRKRFRKKTDEFYPNDESVWSKTKKFFFPDDSEGKKSKIGDLRPPMSPIEHVQAETAQHSEELSRLKALIKDLAKKQEIMDQKQDLMLEYLKPKRGGKPTDAEESVNEYDVTKSDGKSASVGGEYKLTSSAKKPKREQSSSSSDTDDDDDDLDDDKEEDDD